jgi:transketolase
MQSQEWFDAQDDEYRERVLPRGVKRISIEAGHPMSWQRWVGSDCVALGINRFGASAPAEDVFKDYGFTVENVIRKAKRLAKS